MTFTAEDRKGGCWHFDVPGAFTTYRGGLVRADTVWKALGRANVVVRSDPAVRLVLLTSQLPKPRSEGDKALHAAGPEAFFDAIAVLSDEGVARLAAYARGTQRRPLPGFWTAQELAAG